MKLSFLFISCMLIFVGLCNSLSTKEYYTEYPELEAFKKEVVEQHSRFKSIPKIAWSSVANKVDKKITENEDENRVAEEGLAYIRNTRRTPCIIKNVPFVKKWKALSRWTPSLFSKYIDQELGFLAKEEQGNKLSVVDMYTIFESAPMASLPSGDIPSFEPSVHIEEMSPRKFFTKAGAFPNSSPFLSRNKEDAKEEGGEENENTENSINQFISAKELNETTIRSYLFSKVVPQMLAVRWESDIQPNVFLRVNTIRLDGEDGEDTYEPVDIWMGSPGSSIHMHYDFQHNFYVPVHGNVVFNVAPPSASEGLGLFPGLHPRHRQTYFSVAGLLEEEKHRELTQDEQLALLSITTAVLEPGDVLYIPPCYFQETIVLTPTIYTSNCHPSEEDKVVNSMEFLPIPFEEGWSRAKQVIALRSYINFIISNSKLGDPEDFISTFIWTSRYEKLFGPMEEYQLSPNLHYTQGLPKWWCISPNHLTINGEDGNLRKDRPTLVPSNADMKLCEHYRTFEEIFEEELYGGEGDNDVSAKGNDLVTLLKGVEKKRRGLIVATLIETLANFFVGTEYVPLFFVSWELWN